jgi:hypothetical protein
MAFGNQAGTYDDGRTQADLVEETITATPSVIEENMKLAGLKSVLSMSERQLIEFFTLVLKSRSNMRELDFTLGDYDYKELQARIPGANNLHEKPFKEAARVIALALQQDPRVVGLSVKIDKVDNKLSSSIKIKIAEVEPVGPHTCNGKVVAGDKEFDPQLIIQYTPIG